MIYFNNLKGRDYKRAYGETESETENKTGNKQEIISDPIIFDLDDNQAIDAMNEDWKQVKPGQMAMVVDGNEKLDTTVYKVTAIERKKDVATHTESFIVRGSAISKLPVKGDRYNISFMLHGIAHKRLTDGCFQRGVNLIASAVY
ncbi:hypothetical protein [Shewanella sp. UCD-KL12]|uniref:hypothetical protein n=1 Tax=Shewanella sp. UCD-KL12 TaxID=1917163 RepID=UPI000970FF89|nr:hypothetical protein [Shewanella sp. UCD-KL12]